MIRTVLVALDGSADAERVLPYVERIARESGGRAVLVRAVPASEEGAAVREAEEYLEGVRASLARRKVAAEARVARGEPAVAVLREAEDRGAGLLAFTAYGQGGRAPWAFGAVAQKLVRGGARPLFVARALEEAPRFRSVLVPLDGSVGSEAVLPHAFFLARAFGAAVRLLYVAPPGEPEARDRLAARFAEVARSRPGMKMEAVLDEGDPARRILERAEEGPGSVIAMGSHGRTGFSRWALGGVSEKVLQAARAPIFLARHTDS